MSCERANDIDVAAFLTDADDADVRAFRDHYPDCDACARAVAGWSALDAAVRRGPPDASVEGLGHPGTEELERYADALAAGGEGGAALAHVRTHLDGCGACRTEVSLLQAYDPATLVIAANEGAAARARPVESTETEGVLGRLLGAVFGPAGGLGLTPATAGALTLLVLGALAIFASGVLDETGGAPAAPEVQLVEEEGGASAPNAAPDTPGLDPALPESIERLARDEPAPAPDPRRGESPAIPAPPIEPEARRESREQIAANDPDEAHAAPSPDPEATVDEGAEPTVTLLAALDAMPLPGYSAPADPGSAAWMREMGAVRSERQDAVIVAAAPDHVGLTGAASPTLWWSLEAPTAYDVEVVVIGAEAIDPLVELVLEGPHPAGERAFRLSDRGLELAVGETFQWSVRLLVDPQRPSRNPGSGGLIERIAPDDPRAEAAAAPERSRGHALSRAGLWYDAYDFFSRLAAAHPGETRVERHRAALLAAGRDEAGEP